MTQLAPRTLLMGVPSSAGAAGPGVEAAFGALREAGLVDALRASDPLIEDRGHLSLFPFRAEPGTSRARNVHGVACAAEAVLEELLTCGGQARSIVVGGGCALLAGVVAAVARLRHRPPGVILLDAHADLNTPETSPSGLLDGMALALALGRGPQRLLGMAGDVGWPPAVRAAALGLREIDPEERPAVDQLGLVVTATALRDAQIEDVGARALAVASDGFQEPVVVHLDLDVIDPDEMQPKPGGPPGPGLPLERLSALLGVLWGSPSVASLLVTGFDPAQDASGTMAPRIVGLLAEILSGSSARKGAPLQDRSSTRA